MHALLAHAVDMHVHALPDHRPRLMDAFEVAEAARAAGMKAVVLKDHDSSSVETAALTGKAVPGIDVWGGIALNKAVGGFNPSAVEVAIRRGAKVVWMPTWTAASHLRCRGQPYEHGLSVFEQGLDARGDVRAEVLRIVDLVAEANVVLATGHLHASEMMALLPLARRAGLSRFVVTHPENQAVALDLDSCLRAAGDGAYLEFCYRSVTLPASSVTLEHIAATIRQVGAGRCILASDLGEAGKVAPVEGLNRFVEAMLEHGLSEEEIDMLTRANPVRLLYD